MARSTRELGSEGPDPLSSISAGLLADHEEEHRADAVLDGLAPEPEERFQRVGPLGRGGTADVDLVLDELLGREAASKVIRPELGVKQSVLRSFVREAQITSELEHPYIVPIHSIGRRADGRVFITMRRIVGKTLTCYVGDLPKGPLRWHHLREIVDLVLKVCDALCFAHDRGVLHRDVKPGNVMVGDYGRVYLIDWGLFARYPEGRARERAQRAIVGTPAYMAPEQATGDHARVGPWTDVFGVGGLLYYAVTRRPPYDARSVAGALAASGAGRFPSVSQRCGSWVPLELDRIIGRAMAVDPGARFASMAELRDALIRFRSGDWAFARRDVPVGEVIVREGTPAREAYFITKGACQAVLADRPDAPIRVMRAGDVFGETAIFSGGLRTASVVALEPTTVLVFDRRVLDEALEAMGPSIAPFVRALALRFSEAVHRDPR